MDTTSDKSPFRKTFVTKGLQRIDSVFQPDLHGNYLASASKIGEHVPVLLAALQTKPDLYDLALERPSLSREATLSMSNLSRLHRLRALARILGMGFAILLDALDLFSEPFVESSRTLDVYRTWNRISAAGLSVTQLRCIPHHANDPLQPLGPTQSTTLESIKTVLDGMSAIQAAHSDLTSEEKAVVLENFMKEKATLLFSPSVVEKTFGIVEGTAFYTTNAPVGLAVDTSGPSGKIIYSGTTSNTTEPIRATLSVKGVLTDAEEQAALAAFSGDDARKSAFPRLRKQAVNSPVDCQPG